MNLGLIVPCRNEARVIARKLRNLRQLDWPEAQAPHRVIVVDDNSEDETAGVARAEIEALRFPDSVQVEVIANALQPGKPGAVRAALARLGTSVACCGLTDADVILDSAALRLMLEAFQENPKRMMLSGEQLFVDALADSGSTDGNTSVPGDAYDRATAWWRRVESRCGALFSVHGQLLLWRAELELEPRLDLAADDLDLMLQVRAKRPHSETCLVSGATFYECKTLSGSAGDAQALRRARAYIQVMRSKALPPEQSFARKVQWLAYRYLPLAAPSATLVCMFSMLLVATVSWGALGGALAATVLLLGAWTKPGRTWLRAMRMIRLALRAEAQGTLAGQWEMARN